MLLTVGILSYNRPVQLERCLRSLLPLPNDVNVSIYDDSSPKIDAIRNQIQGILLENSNINLISNQRNLGYDMNLLNALSSSEGEYVLLLSDDDWLEDGALNNIANALSSQDISVAFVRYCEYHSLSTNSCNIVTILRRNWNADVIFKPGAVASDGSLIYNSILFSGLIFKRILVCDTINDFYPYKNSIYIQVALFAFISNKHGSQFISGPGIVVGSDGENGFGLNSAALNDSDLSDRSSVVTNLKFNRRLLVVVENIANRFGAKFSKTFFREFNFRNFSGMRFARNAGRATLLAYWRELGTLTRHRMPHHYLIFVIMLIFPRNFVRTSTRIADFMVRLFRARN